MSKIHFVSTNLDLNLKQQEELGASIESDLRALGRPDDAVVILVNASWDGCVDMYDEEAEQ